MANCASHRKGLHSAAVRQVWAGFTRGRCVLLTAHAIAGHMVCNVQQGHIACAEHACPLAAGTRLSPGHTRWGCTPFRAVSLSINRQQPASVLLHPAKLGVAVSDAGHCGPSVHASYDQCSMHQGSLDKCIPRCKHTTHQLRTVIRPCWLRRITKAQGSAASKPMVTLWQVGLDGLYIAAYGKCSACITFRTLQLLPSSKGIHHLRMLRKAATFRPGCHLCGAGAFKVNSPAAQTYGHSTCTFSLYAGLSAITAAYQVLLIELASTLVGHGHASLHRRNGVGTGTIDVQVSRNETLPLHGQHAAPAGYVDPRPHGAHVGPTRASSSGHWMQLLP
jgi:hypothetical protein